MARFVVDAIVLKHVDYADSDRIITAFSLERGRIEGRARGVRKSSKRFAGRLDLFTRGQVTIREGRGAPKLEAAEITNAYLGMRVDLDRLAWAGVFSELVLKLYGEGEPHPAAFASLAAALEHLDQPDPVRCGLLYLQELRLLQEAGLKPELGHCVGCGGEVGPGRTFVFHVARGGALCDRCLGVDGGLKVDAGTLRLLQRGMSFSPEKAGRLHFNAAALSQTKAIIWAFLRYHVGGSWRARRFLDQLLVGPAV